MPPTTRHTTNLPPLPITLIWLSHYKSHQALLLQRLAALGARSITFPTTLPSTYDLRLISRSAFRNAARRALNLAALPGAQIWDAWLILPAEAERAGAVNDAVNLCTERWDDALGRLRRLPPGSGVECWFTLRELEEGEELFEEEGE